MRRIRAYEICSTQAGPDPNYDHHHDRSGYGRMTKPIMPLDRSGEMMQEITYAAEVGGTSAFMLSADPPRSAGLYQRVPYKMKPILGMAGPSYALLHHTGQRIAAT